MRGKSTEKKVCFSRFFSIEDWGLSHSILVYLHGFNHASSSLRYRHIEGADVTRCT